ncbi:helix-turn-helix domain-containing protein [Amycolatopsis cynarae]|uniref:Helix-turn-helix domain-containing protein n=1 Tax=Amycolatopsis cynarae TaxID=2995223 RepID=A0ABY7BC79_9PSEU|nr:helix-turn-helix domain-containing protein [Amycolatopsis sp. HUAS 11-8]WAL68491.1 helix-turn-helix domain-containing protein [Amycolatopsis sp. HUAS 11-8]
MTADKKAGRPAVLSIADVPVAARIRARAPRLTRSVVARLMAELPAYTALPQEEIAGDISDIVQRSLRLLADVIERRRPAADHELVRQRESAAQRAEEGVPLDAILSAYQIGMTMIWQEIAGAARPSDWDTVQRVLAMVMDLQRQLVSAVSAAYLDARQTLDHEEHSVQHAMMTALLAGDPLEEICGRTGLRAAPRYVVLALALAPHPDEAAAGPKARIATRRKVRRIRALLDLFAGEPALTAMDGAGGTVLLPVAEPPAWDALRELVSEAAKAADTAITGAAATADPPGVPAAVTQVTEVLDLVSGTGRPPGLYRLADVLLDYQLSRPSAALDGLAALLRPLAGKPELLRTLELYLAHDLDRRRTGAALHVHPNTVGYRVRRITELTGLDLSRPTALPLVFAALAAHRAVAGVP